MLDRLSPPFARLKAALSPVLTARSAAYAVTTVLHVTLLAALINHPVVRRDAGGGGQGLNVQLYTVAGGAGAESDAPLFEPPVAGDPLSPLDAGEAGEVVGGTGDGEGDGVGAGSDAPDTSSDSVDAGAEDGEAEVDPVEPEPIEPEPVEIEPVELALPADALPDPQPNQTDPGDVSLLLDRTPPPPTSEPTASARPAPAPSPPPSRPQRSDAPVSTTQVRIVEGPVEGVSPPPSFAEIVERAGSRLDPADFQLLANFGSGARQTVQESFCLSSAEANREAMDCPDEPNPDSARLAEFGLMGLGEEPPEFLEDMDRLAFELETLGANDTAVNRILTAVRAARRETIEAGPLRRQMGRDSGRTDNLGNPVDDPP